MTTPLSLDPMPWWTWPGKEHGGRRCTTPSTLNGRTGIEFDPRPEYEQDQAKYPMVKGLQLPSSHGKL